MATEVNEVLKLAYETANGTLRDQDVTLANLRNRATGLLGAVAIGTSFAASVGLLTTDPGSQTLPAWAGWTMLVLVIFIGGTVMLTLWPTADWKYGVQAAALLANSARSIDDVHQQAAQAMVAAAASNEELLNRRFMAYRVGVVALILEVVVLVVGVLLV